MKNKYINYFGEAYELLSPQNDKLMAIIKEECENNGIMFGNDKVFKYLQTYQSNDFVQLNWFDIM